MDLSELIASPDDVQRFRVYADQLVERGDPRGELIAVQLELERDPSSATLKEREAKLLEELQPRWLGDLHAHTVVEQRRRGEGVANLAVRWRRGFLDSVRVGPPLELYETADLDFPATITAVLGLQSARLLRELIIGSLSNDDWPASWSGCVEALATSEVPATLRRLEFNRGGYWDISSTELGDLSTAYPRLGGLTELVIEMGAMELGTMTLPALRSLSIITGGLHGEHIQSIVTGTIPRLERLTLYLGESDGDHGCTISMSDLEPIFKATGLGGVRHLGLANSSLADEIAERIADAPVLTQLSTLDLSRGTLSDAGARAMLQRKERFAHLERLDLTRSFLSTAMQAEVRSLAREVIVADQEASDEDYRYVAISE